MRKSSAEKTVNEDLMVKAFAKAIADGDIVNFRLLFTPFSPARQTSTERFETDKYAYLLPNGEIKESRAFKDALAALKRVETITHVRRELEENRPAQYPAELVLMLADNAVRQGKFTAAAQAYELLRIRRKMQQLFYEQAAAALDEDDLPRAVRACLTAAGLAYDYAAFPEPLPMVPNYQTEALKLHGVYPLRPEDCVALHEPEAHIQVALEYLLVDPEAAARLQDRPHATRLEFLQELVRQLDPNWDDFVARYREAALRAKELGKRLRAESATPPHEAETLAEEIAELDVGNPMAITAKLLGRTIENGQWWQYLKELAYQHPASVLFIARQAVGEYEILIPRYRAGSTIPKTLQLVDESAPAALAQPASP